MKKLIAAVMAAAMLLSLLPMTVLADDEDVSLPVTKLYVGTVNALETPQGDGWSFDAETDTLTLNNCTLTESMLHEVDFGDYTELEDAMIYVEGDLTIELIGTNSVERVIEEAPTDYTQYFAIDAAIYPADVNGETWDYPSRLSFTGSGNLTTGIAITADAWDAENWSLVGGWDEYLEFSAAIGCWANGSADLSGLHSGGWMDVYGGILGSGATPWNIKAFANSPTFGDNCIVTAYQDIEGNIENESGYNWNNNDAWRLKIVTGDAILKSNGQLILMDSGAAAGYGWTWENKVLTLAADTEVKAVDFRSGLGSAKLVLSGDVTLDSTGMGYDSNWNNISPISTACDLEINAGSHTLTLTGEGDRIRSIRADLLISGGTVREYADYGYSVYLEAGALTVRNATLLLDNQMRSTTGYDEDWNELPAGDVLFENAVVELGMYIEAFVGTMTVLNSELEATFVMGPDNFYAKDSTITIVSTASYAIDCYEQIVIDNCDLNLQAEKNVLSTAYFAIEGTEQEPDTGLIQLLNMDITPQCGNSVIFPDDWSGYVGLTDAQGNTVTALTATGTKVDPTISQVGANLSYEDLIYVIDIFDVQNAGDIDLTTDAGMLIWTKDEFEAMDGIVFDADHAVVGLKPYKDTGYYYAMSDGIYTRNLHVENYYVGYLKLSDGSYAFSEAKLYNPAIYAENMLGKEDTDTETRELCVALLNFNAAAQEYFHPGTDKDDLVNSGLTDDERELDWTNVVLNLAPVVPEEVMIERDSDVFTATGKNLLFEEMISLGAIYKIDDAIVANATECGTIFWTAEQFAALEGMPSVENFGNGIKTGLTQYRGKAGQWVSNAPEIAAKDMADTQYFILGYVVHADGSVSYSGMMSYTIEQYINNMADDADMGELVMRLYYYERAAKAALG